MFRDYSNGTSHDLSCLLIVVVVMVDQHKALSDTDELTDTLVCPTRIQTINPWESKQQHYVLPLS
jgi:hypothetical protein